MHWEKLKSIPYLTDWLKVQRESKCVVYVCNGGGHSVYWSDYDEAPNRNLIETVLHHEDVDFVEVPWRSQGAAEDGQDSYFAFEGYVRMTLNIKVLSAQDIENEIDSVHPDGSERKCRVWED